MGATDGLLILTKIHCLTVDGSELDGSLTSEDLLEVFLDLRRSRFCFLTDQAPKEIKRRCRSSTAHPHAMAEHKNLDNPISSPTIFLSVW